MRYSLIMAKKKTKKNKVVGIASCEEAIQELLNWHALNSSVDEDEFFVQSQLKAIAAKIWEDAYQAGRSDAKSDAAVEAAEAEWFNS